MSYSRYKFYLIIEHLLMWKIIFTNIYGANVTHQKSKFSFIIGYLEIAGPKPSSHAK